MTAARDRIAPRLEHIVAAIECILEYTSGMDEAAFLASRLVQDVVAWNLTVVGEARRDDLLP